MICPACGQECSGVWIDNGVGHYEFWGAPGVDRQMFYVSNCCETELTDQPDRP